MGNSLVIRSKGTAHDEGDDSFLTFSSIRLSQEHSEQLIQKLKLQLNNRAVSGQISEQLSPTLGGWNIEDLYSEVLYVLVHLPKSCDNQPETDNLVSHLQQVFHIDNEQHAHFLDFAKKKQVPSEVLDLEVSAHKYKHALHLMLVHELDKEGSGAHQWEGHFGTLSEFILKTLEIQGGLTKIDIDFAKWLVYTKVHCALALNTNLFPPLFQTLTHHVLNQFLEDDEQRKFWVATEKLLENFLGFIRNLHKSFFIRANVTSQIHFMLKFLQLLKTILAGHRKSPCYRASNVNADLVIKKVENAISGGANEFFTQVIQHDPLGAEEPEVNQLIKVAHILIDDLNTGLGMYHSIFKRVLNVDYFDITYLAYDKMLFETVKPVVAKICESLKQIDLKNDEDGCGQDKYASIGATLFKLYLAVKKFAEFSSKLNCGNNPKDLCISGTFHIWFQPAVGQWLDIAWFKAENRIRKAVKIDKLKPEDCYVQFTSSAVDAANIFHQIEISWNELSWPEVEGSYTFVATFLDDLCRCTLLYADLMCEKLEEMEDGVIDQKYNISDELCLAINNIERVAEEMDPVADKLGMSKIIEQLAAKNGASSATKCKQTLVTLMDNAKKNVNNKIFDILDKVGSKMRPAIQTLVLEWTETDVQKHGTKSLIKYLDNNLIKLRKMLNKPATFDKALGILWENVFVALNYLITTYVQKQRPPSFFKEIHYMVQCLLEFFYPDGPGSLDTVYNSTVQEIQDLIKVYEPTTPELIFKYYQQRYETQSQLSNNLSKSASLTIIAQYCEDIHTLRIEIMNARNIKPLHDPNRKCDPYVKMQLVPKAIFPKATSPSFKTSVQKKTLFPTFDDLFSLVLSPKELSSGGYVMFTLKDNLKFGRNAILGECLLPLDSIHFGSSNQELQKLPQTYLPFTLPQNSKSIVLKTLEKRHWDKSAAKFARKERTKMSMSPSQSSNKKQ